MTRSEAETEAVGETLGGLLVSGDVVALEGPLGAGKTCFTRGLARGLGAGGPVASPTFTIVREYRGRLPLRHVDLYRLEPGEVQSLDWRELFYGPGVAVVEWADRAGGVLPDHRYRVVIDLPETGDPGIRLLKVTRPRGSPLPRSPLGAGERPGNTGARRRVIDAPGRPGVSGRVLGVDTSTSSRSLAVMTGERIIEDFWGPGEGELVAENLADSIMDLLDAAGLRTSDLELIAVTRGPGSFTGIKVGLASTGSLAYGLKRPLEGVSTLDVLAVAALRRGSEAIVLVDARRGEVYGGAYAGTADPLRAGKPGPWPPARGAPREKQVPHDVDPYLVGPAREVIRSLRQRLGGTRAGMVLAGSGVTLNYEDIVSELGPHWGTGGDAGPVQVGPEHPRATDLILLALERRRSRRTADPMIPAPLLIPAPLYLRAPGITPPPRAGMRDGDPA